MRKTLENSRRWSGHFVAKQRVLADEMLDCALKSLCSVYLVRISDDY